VPEEIIITNAFNLPWNLLGLQRDGVAITPAISHYGRTFGPIHQNANRHCGGPWFNIKQFSMKDTYRALEGGIIRRIWKLFPDRNTRLFIYQS